MKVNLLYTLLCTLLIKNSFEAFETSKSVENKTETLPTIHVNLQTPVSKEPATTESSLYTIWNVFMVVVLVCFSGTASGLTLGLLSLDPVQLKVYEVQGTDQERRQIQNVIKLILQHHLLLVTLLLINSIAMEALPVFFERLVRPWVAVLLSVTLILIFGEILPQAVCLGKWQIKIAKAVAPIIQFFMLIFMPVSWPIAKILDYIVGDGTHTSYYARAHLKALIRLHEKANLKSTEVAIAENSALGSDEINVIEGALDLAEKNLWHIMVPVEKVFMLEYNTILDQKTFQLILETGHSRIPIYSENKNFIKGIILVKSLVTVDHTLNKKIGEVMTARRIIFADPNANIYDLLNEFQKGHSHVAFVTHQHSTYTQCLNNNQKIPSHCTILGIATLEDIIEELIQKEIYDEFDKNDTVVSNHYSIRTTISTHHPHLRMKSMIGNSELPEIVKKVNKITSNPPKKFPVDIPNTDATVPLMNTTTQS